MALVIQRGPLIRFGYNVLFAVFFFLSAPYYLWKMVRRGNWRKGFMQRFGCYDTELRKRIEAAGPIIWIHAVSVGEVNQCVPLQRELQKRLPGYAWLISTTTATGMAELCRKSGGDVIKIYYPTDFAGSVRRALRLIEPRMLLLVEAEVWPNMMWAARCREIPVALVNARLSDRSYARYRKVKFLFAQLFGSLETVCAQSEGDLARWQELGCRPERITLTGNIKFDAVSTTPPGRVDAAAMLERIGVHADAKVIVAGSTHDGEEEILARVCSMLRKSLGNIFLVIVPRHMERGARVQSAVEEQGLLPLRRSRIDSGDWTAGGTNCLIVDTTGELVDFYAAADLIFVGKSLKSGGGQNPLEPAALGKPVIFGDKMANFRDIVRILVGSNAVRVVRSELDLRSTIGKLLENESELSSLGEAAARCIAENRGSLGRTVDALENIRVGEPEKRG